MNMQEFRKALGQRSLSEEERASLTTDELFVLVLARRLDRLTEVEQQKPTSADRQYLASAGLMSNKSVTDIIAAGPVPRAAARKGWKR